MNDDTHRDATVRERDRLRIADCGLRIAESNQCFDDPHIV